MKHVLGMAKSHLDLRGAKGPKLELDLLRLVYAVKELRAQEREAQGYLLVMTEAIKKRTEAWLEKYQAKGTVIILQADLAPDDEAALWDEKDRNIAGMVAGSTGDLVGGRSGASLGERLGEAALREQIMKMEPGVTEIEDESEYPFGIRWDFCGRSDLRSE